MYCFLDTFGIVLHMRRKTQFAEGEYYHVYNRGVEKRDIFLDDYDRDRFQALLYAANGSRRFVYRELGENLYEKFDRGGPLVAIGAYVLMPNHFHILVKEIREGGIAIFMHKLLTAYSLYFNKRHQRVGPLFQGRFGDTHVSRDEHLKYLYAYIHLNPVKEALLKGVQINSDMSSIGRHLSGYEYSSFNDFMGVQRSERSILSTQEFPKYFSVKCDFRKFIAGWMRLKNVYGDGG